MVGRRKRSGADIARRDAGARGQRGAIAAGAAQIIQGDLKAAWYALNRAHDADGGNFYAWYLRGVIFVQMKDAAKASMALDEAVERVSGRV